MEAREGHEHADDDAEREDTPTEEGIDDQKCRCRGRCLVKSEQVEELVINATQRPAR